MKNTIELLLFDLKLRRHDRAHEEYLLSFMTFTRPF